MSVMVDTPEVASETVAEFDRLAPVAAVETDRFCDDCGYNLRTQAVRRDPRTNLLLCRCPECGRFEPVRNGATAGRLWLHRLGTLLLALWIALIISSGFGLGAAQVGATILPIDCQTDYQRVTSVVQAPPALPAIPGLPNIPGLTPGQTTITTTTRFTGQREVRDVVPHKRAMLAGTHGLSAAVGFLLAMLATVVFHHWRRWGYLVLVTLMTLGAGVFAWLFVRAELPELLDWAMLYIQTQAAAHLAGGLAGVFLGRPLARVAVTLILPPRIRQVMAFLWFADGKQLPRVGVRAAEV